EALRDVRIAERLRPNEIAALEVMGHVLLALDRAEEAVPYFRRAHAAGRPRAELHLLSALLRTRNSSEAVRFLETTNFKLPDQPGLYYNIGNAYFNEGRHQDALDWYRKAVELSPGYAEAHCNMGHCLRELGRFQDALEALQRGHELGGKRPH